MIHEGSRGEAATTLLGIGDERKRRFLCRLQIPAGAADELALDTPGRSPYVRPEPLALSESEC